MEPQFPIMVVHSDGDRWILNNREEVARNVEFYDSDDPGDEPLIVTDALRRPVRLKVEALQLLLFEVAGDATN